MNRPTTDMRPALKHRGLRFPRTASEAFRDATWAAAIERPAPSIWQRLLQALGWRTA